MNCDLCGCGESSVFWPSLIDYEYGVEGRWDLVKCGQCGLVRLDPMPTFEDTLGYYPESYIQHHPRTNKIIAPLYKRFVLNQGNKIHELAGSRARILDIGCGCGDFMRLLKDHFRNWDIIGLEPNAAAAGKGRDLWDLEIHQGTLDTVHFEPSSFDAVIFTHVIEHVPYPMAALAKIRGLLKPGGWLFGETENMNCWDARVLQKYWGLVHIPRHLYFFTNDTISAMLRKAGFEDIGLTQTFNPGGWALGWQFIIEDMLFNRIRPGRTAYFPFLLLAAMPLAAAQLALGGQSCAVRFVGRRAEA